MTNRKELKLTAKMRMSRSEPRCFIVMLLWVLAAVLVPQVAATAAAAGGTGGSMNSFSDLISGGIDPETALRLLRISSGQVYATAALNIVLTIYQIVMSFGLARYCLNLYRGDPCGPADLFSGFSMAGRVIGAGVLVALIALGFSILLMFPLAALITFFIMFLSDTLAVILVYAAAVAYIAVLIFIMLAYALTTLALADRPELGAMGAIQYGRNLMRGNKGRLFLLELSFLGWMLLLLLPGLIFAGVLSYLDLQGLFSMPGLMSSLIGLVLTLPYYLWLAPYMQITTAGFYESLHDSGFQPLLPPV